MAPRETPSERRARVSKQTCIPPSQTCLTPTYSWQGTNTYFLTETMQSSTSEITFVILRGIGFHPRWGAACRRNPAPFNGHALFFPSDRVWRRAAKRMSHETTKLHKAREEKGPNQSQRCLVTGDGTDPDACESLPPLTHEENQSVPC